VEPLQLDGAQIVPWSYSRQAPLPLQVPSVPQLEAPASMHWLRASVPSAAKVQTPWLPGSPHVSQIPVQAVAQQTIAHRLVPVSGAGRGRVEQVRAMLESVALP